MPLPDERPRQSVANLIGRFEKQKSSSGAVPPPAFLRTSSVTSYRADESAQEDTKEKREWPPKSVAVPTTSPLIAGPGKRMSPPPSIPTEQEISGLLQPATSSSPTDSKPPNTSQPTASSTVSVPVVVPSPQSQTKATPVRSALSIKPPTHKSTPNSAPAISAEPTALGEPGSMPLKPQDTGQSITSTHSHARAAAKRGSAPPKPSTTATPTRPKTSATTTPIRAKTPQSTTTPIRAKTPQSTTTPIRAKTPQSTTHSRTPSSNPRSKTPSSGLYAPTAASLARSRSGPPVPPPAVTPKRKLTSDLSKPTAAFASRIRSPPNASSGGHSPAGKPVVAKQVNKPAVTKGATPRQSGTAKPRVGKPVAGHSDSNSKKVASTVDSATADTVLTGSAHLVEPTDVAEVDSEEIHELGTHDDAFSERHHENESLHEEEIENYDDDFGDGSHYDNGHGNGHVEEEEVETAGEVSQQDVAPDMRDDGRELLESADEHSHLVTPMSKDVLSDLHHSGDIIRAESYDDGTLDREVVKTDATTTGTDLEDIVHLLETGRRAPVPSAGATAASGGDTVEAGEIPDED